MPINHALTLSITLRSTLVLLLSMLLLVICSKAQTPDQASPLTDAQFRARDVLTRGVEAFKNGQLDEAVQLFSQAQEIDPRLLNARLYLATTYASQYIPGAPDAENTQLGKLATDGYRDVLQLDPQNLSAIDGLASILYQRSGQPFDPQLFAESKLYHQKHIELEPQDPQPYYSVGIIDWALSYRGNTLIREEFNKSVDGDGLKDSDPLPEALRTEYEKQFGPMIDEGIDNLKRALNLKPDYDDAMVYLNLLYRRKADVAATPTEREMLVNQADELLDRVKEIKTKRAEGTQQENR
jgi:tetratricopeptide (TPR) repeat protein